MARLAAPLVALAVLVPTAAVAMPVEDYASYKPQTRCSTGAKPGATLLRGWLVDTFGGAGGPIWRSCRGGSVSEHKEGRAVDWSLDANRKADRDRARRFLNRAFAADRQGRPHAIARRMGIMYVIWDDHMYAAYDRFGRRGYLSSGCKRVTKCSKTLRHRDHMHISLTRRGGYADTSWYASRVAAAS